MKTFVFLLVTLQALSPILNAPLKDSAEVAELEPPHDGVHSHEGPVRDGKWTFSFNPGAISISDHSFAGEYGQVSIGHFANVENIEGDQITKNRENLENVENIGGDQITEIKENVDNVEIKENVDNVEIKENVDNVEIKENVDNVEIKETKETASGLSAAGSAGSLGNPQFNKRVNFTHRAHASYGYAAVLNPTTFHLTDLYYDGAGPKTNWIVGTKEPIGVDSSTYIIDSLNADGTVKYAADDVTDTGAPSLSGMASATYTLKLPVVGGKQLEMKDIKWIALYCRKAAMLFMDVMIPEGFQ